MFKEIIIIYNWSTYCERQKKFNTYIFHFQVQTIFTTYVYQILILKDVIIFSCLKI